MVLLKEVVDWRLKVASNSGLFIGFLVLVGRQDRDSGESNKNWWKVREDEDGWVLFYFLWLVALIVKKNAQLFFLLYEWLLRCSFMRKERLVFFFVWERASRGFFFMASP
jgi:hypothetical protein